MANPPEAPGHPTMPDLPLRTPALTPLHPKEPPRHG